VILIKKDRSQGRVYHLRKIFRRLNGLYFGGQVKARLEWGRRISKRARRSREFGAYYYKDRLIRLHPVLDQSWVPLEVVEAVLHHEMCHQVCPEELIAGRHIAHTKTFRIKEREYLHHVWANQWLDKNLQKLMKPIYPLEKQGRRRVAQQLALFAKANSVHKA
jgi:predicted SprT family Zn-dependent metalloprotease